MIHSLVHVSCEAILSMPLGDHKVIILLLPRYQCRIVLPVNKYKFPFHIIFSYLMASVSNMYDIYSVFYHIKQY